MRERVEDLGRLMVMIRHLLDQEIFNDLPIRKKDYYDWFIDKSEDQKQEIIEKWVYGISYVSEELYEMLSITQGHDHLNEKEESNG